MYGQNDQNLTPEDQPGLTRHEYELVQEFAKARLEAKSELKFENLEEYEVPPAEQFSMLKKPTVSIRYKEFNFNTAAVRLFEGIFYVIPSINRNKKRFAVLMRKEETSSAIIWSKRNKKGVIESRVITSLEFTNAVYEMMGWDKNLRYKTVGRVANSVEGLILVFDLEKAIKFDSRPSEYTDPQTGKVKKYVKAYYPEMYRGRIGNYYNDYVAYEQMNMFEALDDYSDKQKEVSETTKTGG